MFRKPKNWLFRRIVSVLLVMLTSAQVYGQAYKAEVGFNRLRSEVGARLSSGADVIVAMAEANVGGAGAHAYFPTSTDPEFAGKTLVDVSALVGRSNSGHATFVAQLFFGNTLSMAPGVRTVQVYDADNFVFVQQRLGNAGVNRWRRRPFPS